MAKKVTGLIKLALPAGKATPAPPVGPALGQHGVNIAAFCKEYNAKTTDKIGLIIPVEISVYEDRSKLSFQLLDSIKGKNIHRIYPHKLFCDSLIKKRCITHNDKDIFYSDDNHTSYKGSIMINDLIIKKLKEILD